MRHPNLDHIHLHVSQTSNVISSCILVPWWHRVGFSATLTSYTKSEEGAIKRRLTSIARTKKGTRYPDCVLKGTTRAQGEIFQHSSTAGEILGHEQSRLQCFQVQPVACCDLSRFFLYDLEVYSIHSSKMVGKFFLSVELQPVISQTKPIHLKLH